ncbi:MAG: DUF4339 domain-containing protein [Verrucomicrobiae bacterium]|nr:DUF4339 domain-containing protein [Verrucomicrobiae bacterium]
MKRIYIAKAGLPPGSPLTLQEAKAQLTSGQLFPRELAWCEGLSDWQPLSSVIFFAEGRTPAAPIGKGKGARRDGAWKDAWLAGPRTERILTQLFATDRPLAAAKLTSRDLGELLWKFCRSACERFCGAFRPILVEAGIPLDPDAEYLLKKESLVTHLWACSKVLKRDRSALDQMHRAFLGEYARAAATVVGSDDQLERHREAIQRTLYARYQLYYNLWNKNAGSDQSILCTYWLEIMLNREIPVPGPRFTDLLGFLNAYLRGFMREVAATRGKVELIRDHPRSRGGAVFLTKGAGP